jgi:hypothetical protein
MRTLGFRTHVLLALAAAVGVVAALGRPWYAPAPRPVEEDLDTIGKLHGPVDGLAQAMERWVTETAGTTGWDALGIWATVLAAAAALAAAGALGCLVPALQGAAREGLRYGGLTCAGVALWKLVDTPGPNEVLEPRFGAFLAVAAALVVFTSGSAAAAAPLQRRRAAPVRYVPPAPPATSAPPPGS